MQFNTRLASFSNVDAEHTRWRIQKTSTALGMITALWLVAAVASIVAYHIKWNQFPEVGDVVMSFTLLAPLALPASFGAIIGVLSAVPSQGVLVFGLAYWPCVLGLQFFFVKNGAILIYLILCGIVGLSSLLWVVIGTGMMGI